MLPHGENVASAVATPDTTRARGSLDRTGTVLWQYDPVLSPGSSGRVVRQARPWLSTNRR